MKLNKNDSYWPEVTDTKSWWLDHHRRLFCTMSWRRAFRKYKFYVNFCYVSNLYFALNYVYVLLMWKKLPAWIMIICNVYLGVSFRWTLIQTFENSLVVTGIIIIFWCSWVVLEAIGANRFAEWTCLFCHVADLFNFKSLVFSNLTPKHPR